MAAAITALMLVAVSAQAIPPAYEGPLGNPEEPALRPYKWMYRGLQALSYHTVGSFVEGNVQYPVVGTVYVFRGLRIGSVELARSAFVGMIGANPKAHPNNHCSEVGLANQLIEEDLLLRTVLDGAWATVISPCAWPITVAAQQALYCVPPVPEWEPISREEYLGDIAEDELTSRKPKPRVLQVVTAESEENDRPARESERSERLANRLEKAADKDEARNASREEVARRD
jgi:hypothetical protein